MQAVTGFEDLHECPGPRRSGVAAGTASCRFGSNGWSRASGGDSEAAEDVDQLRLDQATPWTSGP